MGFSFYDYITYFASFIITFGNPFYYIFSECKRGEYSFKFLGCLWLLIVFVVCSIPLILSFF